MFSSANIMSLIDFTPHHLFHFRRHCHSLYPKPSVLLNPSLVVCSLVQNSTLSDYAQSSVGLLCRYPIGDNYGRTRWPPALTSYQNGGGPQYDPRKCEAGTPKARILWFSIEIPETNFPGLSYMYWLSAFY